MRYYLSSLLFVLAAGFLAALTTPVALDWDIMQMKHAWNSVPINWESLGPPPVGTTINLHIFLKSHHEDVLIDTLYQVSNPEHPKCVPSSSPREYLLTCVTTPFPDMART
jgi:tripeptidyl-peptidase I